MAQNLASMVVRIGADITDFERKMSKAERTMFQLGGKINDLGRRMTLGVTLPITAAGAAAVKFATDLDALKRGLIAVSGSSQEAERQLVRLKEVAKLPGLGFTEAIEGSINLQAAGFSAELAERALMGFGNALATVGRGKAELDGVIRALSQIAAKGKVSAEEINQIAERVPQIRKVMEQAFGTANTEALQKMGIDATEFIAAIVTELEKLPRVSGGVKNSFENLADSSKMLAANIGNQLLPPVIAMVERLSTLFERLQKTNPEIIRWGIALAAVAALQGPLLMLTGTILKLTVAVRMLVTGKLAALAAAITPGGALLVGLAALSALFIKNKLDALSAAGAANSYADSLRTLGREAASEKSFDISRRRAELLAERAGLPATTQSAPGQFGVTIKNPRVAEIDRELAGLNEQFRIVTQRLTDLRNGGENAIKAGITSPLNVAATAAANLRGELERLDDAIRTRTRIGVVGGFGGVGTPEIAGRVGGPEDPLARLRNPAAEAAAREAGRSPLSKIGGELKDQIGGIIAQFGPLAAVAAALRPVFQGIMEAVGPALKALAEPLRMVGQLLGLTIVPVLKLLENPLIFLAKATSYVTEAFGWMIRAIGKAIDALPLISAKSIIKAGQEMMDGAKNVRRGMDLAAESAERLAGTINNLANVFPLAFWRNKIGGGATVGGTTGGGGGGGGGGGIGGNPFQPGGGPQVTVINNFHGITDTGEITERVARSVARVVNRGGTPRLALA